ncbi:(Fe-S)-binding protein [Aquiflexum gelatinilyticum]|uniref:(Fe-S)-binding protein n=1 Tax=Aquiflexum gelatinilyticum TaxID=2961943 RepID=A0A9X2PC67_9BACT|nr:(Fe-S)-binding protein [Aquiflexum gelatinilyticum]MCR9016030.1 (Fe-S)-binding protein [Aquiflexum gelatinilyticum]
MPENKIKIGLFIPCYVDQFYPKVAIATLELLEKLGCQVKYPMGQTCCGQPMANAGYERDTIATTRHFIRIFKDFDYVVAPSGSCVLHVKEHAPVIAGMEKEQAELHDKIFELTEFLTDILKIGNIKGSFPHRVGFHASCHGQRGLRLSSSSELHQTPFNKAKQLMVNLEGLEWVELERKDECCGFGGTFAVSEEALSIQMGKDRLADHQEHQVEILTGGDMSCIMHLQGIAKRNGNPIQFKHIAEILNEAIS